MTTFGPPRSALLASYGDLAAASRNAPFPRPERTLDPNEKQRHIGEVPVGTSDVQRTLGNAGGRGAAEANSGFLSRFFSGECIYGAVIVNVTTLGSGAGGAARSVGNIVNYLEGRSLPADRQLDRPGSAAQTLEPNQGAGPGRYYADSGDGRWIGRGTEGAGFALEGAVERDQVKNMLLGADPNTGQPVMHSRGVSYRANNGQGAIARCVDRRTTSAGCLCFSCSQRRGCVT